MASILAAVALASSAFGCGGATGENHPRAAKATPAEREAVRAAVVRLFKSNDVRVNCERSLTPRLFRLIFTDRAACRKVAADDKDDKPPERVDVSGIEIQDTRATARTRLIGGDTAGAKGVVSLARGSGGWRTDDLSAAFLRSIVEASLRADKETPRVVVGCVSGRLMRLADDRFKRLAYALLGEKPQATVRLLQTVSECERRSGGATSVRRRLEKSVTNELRRAGADRGAIACSLRRLRSTLPDKLIIELAAKDDRPSKARITREVVAAAVACGAGGQTDPGQLSPA
ncbi:MAG: hypothetical protein H0V50_06755 [Thermoleophilaceae bacterium]|nr:hypothetical protein [Thermoleophilaceae bacterium]